MNIKNERKLFMVSLTLGKFSLDAKPMRILILKNLSVVPVFTDMQEFTLEGNPKSVINRRVPQPRLCAVWPPDHVYWH